jgi:ribosomal protein S6--L-glutamate ligase
MMRIGILSRMPRCYSTRRLKEAATARGHRVQVLDTLRFSMMLEQGEPDLYYRHRRIGDMDAIIPRIGASITFYGLAVVRQFEQMGVYVTNDSMAIARSRDKLRALQTLSRYDIGITPTAFVRDGEEVLHAIDRVGGVPVIIKLLEGTQGVGVILAETVKVAEAIIQTLQSAKQNVLIQKFVKESKGSDIRAFVVGDRVIAAMKRSAKPGEFRSNVHRGGQVQTVELDEAYTYTAIRAAQIMGLNVAGVDLLESEAGPQVLEVNSSPGLEGIERATGIDVADAIVEHIEQNVLLPDVDLKQRLRLTGGYGVAEFPVHNMPELDGKAVRDTGLAERNITVMSISRHNTVIQTPRGGDVIHEGDVLLCYGDLHELRMLVPPPKRKRRKRLKKKRPASS